MAFLSFWRRMKAVLIVVVLVEVGAYVRLNSIADGLADLVAAFK
jgi:hypothetical protein